MRGLLMSVAAVALLAACGQKGPLYMPASKPAQKQPAKPVPPTPASGSEQPS